MHPSACSFFRGAVKEINRTKVTFHRGTYAPVGGGALNHPFTNDFIHRRTDQACMHVIPVSRAGVFEAHSPFHADTH